MTPNSDEFVNNEPIPLDTQGRAHTAEGSACSYACRTVSDDDVKVILDLKHAFENPIAQIREGLQNIDNGCPHIHHLKPRGMDDGLACTEIFKLGHPLPCSSEMCNSKLRVLLAASVHYPVLQNSCTLYIWQENVTILLLWLTVDCPLQIITSYVTWCK